MSLSLELRVGSDGLVARFTNPGPGPVALVFWWTRSLRVVDRNGRVVAPGPGPVLPCGVAEDWTVLAPGESLERPEPLGCTQPAGRPERIGWNYELPPGRYTVIRIHEAPPPHGFLQSEPHPRAFAGRIESGPLEIEIGPRGAIRAG